MINNIILMFRNIIYKILIFFISIEFIKSIIILTESNQGNINGYFYALGYHDNTGKVKMSINENNFTCYWKNIDSSVSFQYGKIIDPQKTLDELGNVIINYETQINSEGYIFTGIIGIGDIYELFSIIEYYSDEFVPFGISLGTMFIDDGEYEIYYNEMIVSQTHIDGTNKQIAFYSVRKEKRLKGTINLNKHFESWKKKGCKFELLSRISFIVEGNKSNGNVMVNQLEIKYEKN